MAAVSVHMAVEIEYSNPTELTGGMWQVEMARNAVSNAPSGSQIGDTTDIERQINGGTLIVALPDGVSQTTIDAVRTAIESALSDAVHVETR